MISVELVIKLHKASIVVFGGKSGLRDIKLLESAVYRPFQTFEGKELYKSIEEKASALIESIIKNHPFIDGNKRTGYLALLYFLWENGLSLIADQNEKYNFILNIASGKFSYDDILKWLRNHTQKLSDF